MRSKFSAEDLAIWHSIYGPSRGPTQGRLRILVEEFESRGLAPVMMRVGDEMLPYKASDFLAANREACQNKDDDHVQVYYHPVDCERVVGSTAGTWTQWGRLILSVQGLVPPAATDECPAVIENVPRLRLPTAVRDMLKARGVTTSSMCRLVSARMVAFYIAAQYEAWATPAEVGQVAPFKSTLARQGYKIREVLVRKDAGLDSVLSELEAEPDRQAQLDAVLKYATNYPPGCVDAPATPEPLSSEGEFRRVFGRHADEFLQGPDDDCEGSPEEEIIDDIDAEIVAVQARLNKLMAQKEELRRADLYLQSSVVAVSFDKGGLVKIVLQLPGDGPRQTFNVVPA